MTDSYDVHTPLFKIQVEEEVIGYEIDCLLSSAFEGGSNYWIEGLVYPVNKDYKGAEYASQVVSRGGCLEIKPDGEGIRILTLEKVEAGIPLLLKHKGKTWREFFENHDAGDADDFLQFAMFGELVYR